MGPGRERGIRGERLGARVGIALLLAPAIAHAAEPSAFDPPALLTGLALVGALGALGYARLRVTRQARALEERAIEAADLTRSLEAARSSVAALERTRAELLDHTAATVREPLTLLLGTLDQLGRSPMLPFEVRGAVEQSIRLGKEASAGVGAIADAARLRSGELRLAPMAVDLRAAVDSAIEGIRRREEIVAPSFHVHAASDLPYAFADNERITQALTTLLGRAAQLSDDGVVHVRLAAESDTVTLSFEDGRARSEPDVTFLTAPALPAITSGLSPIDEIRLWIAGRILLLHGYAIACAPRDGGGFRWTLSLPRAKAEAAAPAEHERATPPRADMETLAPPASPLGRVVHLTTPAAQHVAIVPGLRRSPLAGALAPSSLPKLEFTADSESSPGGGETRPRISLIPPASVTRGAFDPSARETLAPASLRRRSAHVPEAMPIAADPMTYRPRVLVADDDPVVRNVIAAELTELDVDVTMAVDGVDALARIQSEAAFDLVVSDILMPRLTGLQLCKIVRETHSNAELPFVLMSASPSQEEIVRAFEAGASDFLVKPTVKAELLQRIATHLQIAREAVALSRFVPREFLRLLGRERVADVRLGDHVSKDITILFADIRGFTSMSESFGPGGTFRFLNGCLSRIAPHITENGGFIDKYIGDAVMALFPTHALGAVRAAIAIQKEVDAYNREHSFADDDSGGLAIGVGIFRGPTMLGTIGEPRRFEATVISDAVNVAARLEALTRRLGVRVLVGETVLKDLAEASLAMRPLGRVVARGRGEPVAIWELLDAESEDVRRDKSETMDGFLSAIEHFEKGAFAEAIAAFDGVLERSPNDGPSWVYQQACQRFLTNEIPFGFQGALDFGTDK
jgi:class 3 adenylate cyclase